MPPPTLSLRLCDRAELSVAYSLERDAPAMELHCARLEREDQAELTREFERVDEEIRSEGAYGDLLRHPFHPTSQLMKNLSG